ncbi:uncharacterized protein LOC111030516 [Myzus persicae]|uniref:uncharacterized protein LOC111030516 n=1 Tax=Myzus persicae TaxID=13164 RepID=UPI000B93700F|nr:uncharacterized protein LOC111030516 [Myzus persicae]
MDEFTEHILKAWGFEDMVTIFKDEEIDQTELLNLTEDMIKELFPKIGKRSKFFSKLKEYKKTSQGFLEEITHVSKLQPQKDVTYDEDISQMVIEIQEPFASTDLFSDENLFPEGTSNDLDPISINTDTSERSIITDKKPNYIQAVQSEENPQSKVYVTTILNNYADGKLVFKYYDTFGTLNQSMRNTLSSIVIKHEIQECEHNLKIEKNKFSLLAEGIEKLFPNEIKETYFTPYCKDGNNVIPMKGKLYDKYCNLKKQIKKININSNSDVATHSGDVDNHNFIDSDYEDKILWLKNNTQPSQTLQTYWVETVRYRHHKKHNLMELYPALNRPLGHFLIELDFKHLYPEKDFKLLNKIDVFVVKLIEHIKSANYQFGIQGPSILKELQTPSNPGNEYTAVFKLLPLLFQPLTIKLNGKRKIDGITSVWRPSKAEQAAAFITFISDVGELKIAHKVKVDKAFEYGLKLQPYVIVINSTEFFVVIDNTYYKLETLIKAVDVCFKSFFSLNVHYPTECEQVWLFIQHYFFEIKLKSDKSILSVKTLVNDFHKL